MFNPDTRQLRVWTLDQGVQVQSASLPGVPKDWRVVDFCMPTCTNQELFLFNERTRSTSLWELSGWQYVSGIRGPTIPHGSRAIAYADFNGDGQEELLIFSLRARTLELWTLSVGANALVVATQANLPSLPLGWVPRDAEDFDQDGRADILLQSADGRIAVWYIDGSTRVGSGFVNRRTPAGWRLITARPYHGGISTDLFFEREDGATAIWSMNGLTLVQGLFASPTPAGWMLVEDARSPLPDSSTDIDGDEHSDTLLHEPLIGSRRTYNWLLNDGNKNEAGILPFSSYSWDVRATRNGIYGPGSLLKNFSTGTSISFQPRSCEINTLGCIHDHDVQFGDTDLFSIPIRGNNQDELLSVSYDTYLQEAGRIDYYRDGQFIESEDGFVSTARIPFGGVGQHEIYARIYNHLGQFELESPRYRYKILAQGEVIDISSDPNYRQLALEDLAEQNFLVNPPSFLKEIRFIASQDCKSFGDHDGFDGRVRLHVAEGRQASSTDYDWRHLPGTNAGGLIVVPNPDTGDHYFNLSVGNSLVGLFHRP